MGLRVSEIVHIKIEDIDSKAMRVLIGREKEKKIDTSIYLNQLL